MFHSFDEVDVDLTTWWPVAQRDRQGHAEEEFTIVGRVELRSVIGCDRGVESAVFKPQARECLMVCVWVPNLHEETDQNDYCGTTRPG